MLLIACCELGAAGKPPRSGGNGLARLAHCSLAVKRALLTLATFALCACADEAITPAHLDVQGTLRSDIAHQSNLTSSSAQTRFATAPAATIEAVLARESTGALLDDAEFTSDVGKVHLHLRTSGLAGARPVAIRWVREDVSADGSAMPAMADLPGALSAAIEHDGVLQPSDKLVWADSLDVRPGDVGAWRVEVRGITASAPLLYERSFVIRNRADREGSRALSARTLTPARP